MELGGWPAPFKLPSCFSGLLVLASRKGGLHRSPPLVCFAFLQLCNLRAITSSIINLFYIYIIQFLSFDIGGVIGDNARP